MLDFSSEGLVLVGCNYTSFKLSESSHFLAKTLSDTKNSNQILRVMDVVDK